jgi:hypothetical protein
MHELVLETAFVEIFFEREHGFLSFLSVPPSVNSWFHGESPFIGGRDCVVSCWFERCEVASPILLSLGGLDDGNGREVAKNS